MYYYMVEKSLDLKVGDQVGLLLGHSLFKGRFQGFVSDYEAIAIESCEPGQAPCLWVLSMKDIHGIGQVVTQDGPPLPEIDPEPAVLEFHKGKQEDPAV